MLKLNNVTLVSLSTSNVEASVKAIEYSCKEIEFGCVKLISHYIPEGMSDYIEFNEIKKATSIDDWSYKVIYELPKYINTEFIILIHPDGFIVNPSSWRDDFLDYDYIGAPWPMPSDNFSYRDINQNIVRVGNSVSLRSKRLLDLPNKLNLEWKPFHGYYNEDGYIAVNYRHKYEENGMKFADIDVAKYFSHESMIPEIQGIEPFCFHKWNGTNAKYPRF